MASIARVLGRIKTNLASYLEPVHIESLCQEFGHVWRCRILDPVTTLHLFILQILHGNTACSHLAHLARLLELRPSSRRPFTASAYCQARRRLPVELITALAVRMAEAGRSDAGAAPLWHGHRTVLMDGSGFSMPDTPVLQARFGQPGGQKKGCGFPVAHLLAVFDAQTGLALDLIAAPLRTHDMSRVREAHARLRPGDVIVADRGFCSYAHLALILEGNLHACLRVHQKQIVRFSPHRRHATRRNARGLPRARWLRRLGVCDQIVEWPKPAQRPKWMSEEDHAALPESITLRELKYKVGPRGFRVRAVTLVTTLLDAETYPASELAELYRRRWEVETNLRHLKTTLGMDILHCKTVDGILKEMWMFALVYNLVRLVMLETARQREVEPARVSFIDAARWLALAAGNADTACVVHLASLIINPARAHRVEPRVIKRRLKEFLLMKKPRDQLRQDLRRGNLVA